MKVTSNKQISIINLSLPAHLHRTFKILCIKHGYTMTDILQQMVKNFVKDHKR